MKIDEAIEFFLENRDVIPIFTLPQGDYAVPFEQKKDVYLVVERQGKGIFVARLSPELLELKPVVREDLAEDARNFIYQRLLKANLVPSWAKPN